MGFDDNDWGTGSEQGLNLAPTEEKGEIVIDVNSPETITSQLRKGLNNTPTRMGFYDGTQWTNYLSSDGKFKVGNGSTGIEYDPDLDETTFTGTINASDLALGANIVIPYDTVGDTGIRYGGGSGGFWTTAGGSDMYTFSRGTAGSYNLGVDPKFPNNTDFVEIVGTAITTRLQGRAPLTNPIAFRGYSQLLLQTNEGSITNYDEGLDLTRGIYVSDLGLGGLYFAVGNSGIVNNSIQHPESVFFCDNQGFNMNKATFMGSTRSITNLPVLNGTLQNSVAITPDDNSQLWIRGTSAYTKWQLNAVMVEVPPHSNSAGVKSQISHDDDYLYICIQTNSWKRIAFDAGTW